MKMMPILSRIMLLFYVLVLLMPQSNAGALSPEQKSIYTSGIHTFDVDPREACTQNFTLAGDSNAAKAFNYFISQGLAPHQAAGIIGNLLAESSLIPNRKQGSGMQTISSADQITPNVGFGIAQWTTEGRQKAWIAFAAKQGQDPLSLELQLAYLMHELKTGSYGYKELQAAADLRQAAWIFLAFFERPATVVDAGLATNPTQPTSGPAKTTLDQRVALAIKAGVEDDVPTEPGVATESAAPCTIEGNGSKFNIGTFNIYYNSNDRDVAYSKEQWQERLVRSVGVIQKNNLDVVGLQEVREDQWARLKGSDRLGATHDIYPSNYKEGGYTAQNPIVWNKSRFDLVKGASIPGYSVTHGADPKGRTQVKLKDKTTGQEFYVINQHEPVGNEDGNILHRYESAKQLTGQVKELAKEGVPVFLTGDFNSAYQPNDRQKTYGGDRNNMAYCLLTDESLLWDAFDAVKSKRGKCPSPDGPGVDHIFMSPVVKATGYDRSNMPKANGSDVHPTVFVGVEIPGAEGVGGGGAISADGHTFPLGATRATVLKGAWCSEKTSNCHHDYNAADIMVPTGTPVLAMIGGKVLSAKDHDDSSVGSRVTIMGDDGMLYYYAHMGDGTIKVKDGQRIDVGKQIGSVGTSADAVGTDPHLHIDALPGKKYKYRPSCSGAACSGYPFYDIQATLHELFKTVK